MDALEAIISRRVQRAFADQPVEREKLSRRSSKPAVMR